MHKVGLSHYTQLNLAVKPIIASAITGLASRPSSVQENSALQRTAVRTKGLQKQPQGGPKK